VEEVVQVVRPPRGGDLVADHGCVADRAGVAAVDGERVAVVAAGKPEPRERDGGDDRRGAREQLPPRHPRLRHV
jgi:hypothetical protein